MCLLIQVNHAHVTAMLHSSVCINASNHCLSLLPTRVQDGSLAQHATALHNLLTLAQQKPQQLAQGMNAVKDGWAKLAVALCSALCLQGEDCEPDYKAEHQLRMGGEFGDSRMGAGY